MVHQRSLGNDQYPKTIAEESNVLSNHCFNVVTNNKNLKRNHRKATKDKDIVNLQNLLLLRWKRNAIVVEKEVINLPNVVMRTDQRKNGP